MPVPQPGLVAMIQVRVGDVSSKPARPTTVGHQSRRGRRTNQPEVPPTRVSPMKPKPERQRAVSAPVLGLTHAP